MKKILLLSATAFMFNTAVKAQFPDCDPMGFPSSLPTHPDSTWIYPEALPDGNVNVDYYQVIYIKFPSQAETEIAGTTYTVTIDSISLKSVTGLPSGFSRRTDKYMSGDRWPGGAYGCVAVYGNTPTAGSYNPNITIGTKITVPGLGSFAGPDTSFSNFTIFISPWAVSTQDFVENAIAKNVYPNPANDQVFVELGLVEETTEFIITNLLGEMVERRMIEKNQEKIALSTSHLPNGLYNYTFVSGSNTQSGKLTIVH